MNLTLPGRMLDLRWPLALVAVASIYAALGTGANAQGSTQQVLEDLKAGDMRKLAVHAQPEQSSDEPFQMENGEIVHISDFEGRIVLLNFWATWCAPCRKEMPSLDEAQARLGGPDFEVVAVATGRNDLNGIKAFYAETGVENLKIYLDPKSRLARDMGILGLPITVILDESGMEIGRVRGDANWSDDNAIRILQAVIDAKAR